MTLVDDRIIALGRIIVLFQSQRWWCPTLQWRRTTASPYDRTIHLRQWIVTICTPRSKIMSSTRCRWLWWYTSGCVFICLLRTTLQVIGYRYKEVGRSSSMVHVVGMVRAGRDKRTSCCGSSVIHVGGWHWWWCQGKWWYFRCHCDVSRIGIMNCGILVLIEWTILGLSRFWWLGYNLLHRWSDDGTTCLINQRC